ncbi:MAG: hypothetical protein O7A09_01705, partial [Proteobacteria bacterium]|nr:hypothetical protein [Pseudomonadota bacterium]
MRAAVLFALLAVVAFGADRPGDIADDVLDALREKDTKRLEELAKRDEPDPWLVAEDLCSRGEHAAAAAFAKAAPRRSVARLPAYVERRRKAGEPERGSKLLAQVKRARRRKDLQGAFNLVEDFEVDSSSLGIASVRLVTGRGELLMALGRPGEAEKDLLAAARYAERLGWMEVAVQNFEQGAAAALAARHLDAAAQARQRALEIARTC